MLSGEGDARARVRLLAYRTRRGSTQFDLRVGDPAGPKRVPAQAPCREIDAQGTLHFLVEPSRSIDPWPLRCTLLDDSYLASRLRRSGGLVTTSAQQGDQDLPGGLTIGRLMIWGYPQRGIPVGLFVDPAVDGFDPRGDPVASGRRSAPARAASGPGRRLPAGTADPVSRAAARARAVDGDFDRWRGLA